MEELLKQIERYKELWDKNKKYGGISISEHNEFVNIKEYISSHIMDALNDGYELIKYKDAERKYE